MRALDANGDMMPCQSLDQLIDGANAVAQCITLRTALLYGEWWEDETIGFRVPRFLIESARANDIDFLGKYIASYIANSEGVQSTEIVSTVFSDRVLTFVVDVITADGEEKVTEVDLSGIL